MLRRHPLTLYEMIDFENGTEKVVLSTWQIDGLSLPPEEAVALLTSLSGFWTGIDGFTIGLIQVLEQGLKIRHGTSLKTAFCSRHRCL